MTIAKRKMIPWSDARMQRSKHAAFLVEVADHMGFYCRIASNRQRHGIIQMALPCGLTVINRFSRYSGIKGAVYVLLLAFGGRIDQELYRLKHRRTKLEHAEEPGRRKDTEIIKRCMRAETWREPKIDWDLIYRKALQGSRGKGGKA